MQVKDNYKTERVNTILYRGLKMKFKKVLENIAIPATSTGDVQGIQNGMGITRRKVGISRKLISSVINKKKKKDEIK